MSLTPSALRLGSDFRGFLEMSGQALTVLPGSPPQLTTGSKSFT